ncbi:MFS transporter [Chloroflexota bacterium]
MGAISVHLFLHLEQGVGLARPAAALIVSVMGIANAASRLLGGFLGDWLPKNLIVGGTMVLIGIASFILAIATSMPMVMAFAVLFGIGLGSRTPVLMAMQGEYFGRKSQGIIRGWLYALSAPFVIAAPVVAGYIADIQDGYRSVFIVIALVALAGAVVFFLAIPPKPPVGKEAAPR